MNNPILAEAMRGSVVENRHRGAIAIVDIAGKMVQAIGDVERPVFPRSSIKSIIALPLVESGAADAYGLGDADLAFASSSHSGEPAHLARAASMLAACGLDASALECGPDWPYGEQGQTGTRQYAASGGQPARICHNCSGKHSGLLCTAVHSGTEHRNYIQHDHPIQNNVRQALEAVTGAAHEERFRGTDGCSIPNYAIPLKNIALGMARMVTGRGLDADRAKAAQSIVTACMNEPFYVAGTDRICTKLMQSAPGEIFAKYGADGVYAIGLPKLGLGIGLKCEDGSPRAAEVMAAGIIRHILPEDHPAQEALSRLSDVTLLSANGLPNGSRHFRPENFQ